MTVQDRPISDHDRSETAQDRSDFVPVAEAARRLGISTATVKRRIAAGTLEAEQLARPQGIEYRVRLPRDVPAPLSERSSSEDPPSTGTMQDISAAITAAVTPLVERLAVQDATIEQRAQTIERQAETIRDQAETIGRQGAELERAASTVVALNDQLDAAESVRRRTTRGLILAVAVLAAVAFVAGTLAAAGWLR